MTAKEKLQYLIDGTGLDEATAKALLENEKLIAKADSFRQATEYQTLEQKAADLEQKFNQSKNYQDWYVKYYPEIQAQNLALATYRERYGELKAPENTPTDRTNTQVVADPADYFNKTAAPRIAALIKDQGRVIERHMRAGRKNEVDWDKLEELTQKTNGNLLQAYEEWDKPEAEKATKERTEAEIQRRVKEEVQREKTKAIFTEDSAPSGRGSPFLRSLGDKPPTEQAIRDKMLQAAAEQRHTPEQVQ